MAYTYPTECDEVAATISIEGVKTFADAVAAVTRMMGTPAEVGYQIHDNIAESLWVRTRAKTAPELAATTHANLRAQVAAEIEHADSFQVAAEIEHADSFQAKPTPRYTTSMIEGHETRWAIELNGVSIGEIRRFSSSYRPVYDLAARIVDLLNQHGEG